MFRRKKALHTRGGYFLHPNINPVIKFLSIADILLISSFGLISPIFAVFIVGIPGGSIEVVGISSAIYLFTKSIFQIPIAHLIDRIKGEKDDFWVMFFGYLGISIIPLLYISINSPIQLYAIQFFYGLFAAMSYPSWMAIFTRHIDKNKEGMEWGVYSTLLDFGSAMSASVGGFLAYSFGFIPLFIIISLVSFIGSIFLIGAQNYME